MEGLFSFLADNYIYFMIAAGVLLIALVGFAVDGKKKKNKLEEVPSNTTTVNEATSVAAPAEPEVPTQPSEPEPSLVFEQPSLNENETMKEISGAGAEPSLTFEQPTVDESAPMDFNGGPSLDSVEEVGTIGEPIVAPDMTISTVSNDLNQVSEPEVAVVPTPEVPVAPMPEAPAATPAVPTDSTPTV